MIWLKIIPSKEYLGNTPVFNMIPKQEPSSGNPVDYLTKLLCGRVSAQFLPDYLCQIKNKETQTKSSKICEICWRNIFFVCAVNFSLYLSGENGDVSPVYDRIGQCTEDTVSAGCDK